ncbi:MAG: hypothetical protein H0V08_01475 [Thermoleophilaceae bacterium]|nr:hypothetical protein [Thermoleophilaceae bacterium]
MAEARVDTGRTSVGADPVREMQAIRVERLRRDARRPMAVNLAEAIALSHSLLKIAGAARRR